MVQIIREDPFYSEKSGQGDFWWKKAAGEPEPRYNGGITAFLRNNRKYNNCVSTKNLRNMRLYGQTDYMNGSNSPPRPRHNHVMLNVVRSCVDTSTSKMAKNRPKPSFLTDNGEWKQQQKAKKLEKFINGSFYQAGTYSIAPDVYKDAAVFGKGIIHYYWEETESGPALRSERVFPEELRIDENEGIYGEPRQLHRLKYVAKEVMASLYPEKAEKIKQAPKPKHLYLVDDELNDMVEVRESWHLPSGGKAKDGIHCLTVDGADLFVEKYEDNWFPFEWFCYQKKLLGFWGTGIAEQLETLQVELNKILRRINISINLGVVPKVFVEAGSKVVSAHLNNEVGGIIKYTGQLPQGGPLFTVPPELYSWVDYLYQKSFQECGISELSAQASKPAGLNSGKALRTFNDIESERFLAVGREWENFFMRQTSLILKMCKKKNDRMVAAGLGPLEMVAKVDKTVEKIKWSEVDMDKDSYIMQVHPTDLFSITPASKLQEVLELVEVGMISQEQGMHLLDFPDLAKFVSSKTAKIDDIMATIDSIVYDGDYNPPEPFQDLQLGVEMFQASYLKYKRKNVPERNLELLRTWITEALDLMNPEPTQLEEDNMEQTKSMAFTEGQEQGTKKMQLAQAVDDAEIDIDLTEQQ